jgi:hypothetical protein
MVLDFYAEQICFQVTKLYLTTRYFCFSMSRILSSHPHVGHPLLCLFARWRSLGSGIVEAQQAVAIIRHHLELQLPFYAFVSVSC